MMLFRVAVTIFALALIAFGLIWTLSPIPFGFVIVALGLLLLIAVAPAEIRWLRRRWRWFDRLMHRLEARLPEWIAKRLRVTDYEHDEDDPKPVERPRPARRGRLKTS
jgi:hypothetical protein